MSTIFLYGDGNRNVIDENGGPEPMDYIVGQNEFIVETIATHTEYMGNAVPNESSLTCLMLLEKPKNEDIHMKEAKLKRDCVRWVSQYNACPDSIFESGKKLGRKCTLTEEHKTAVSSFIDANPSTIVVEVTEHLLKRFLNLKVSCSTVNSFMKRECNLSLKKVDFNSIERNSTAKIEERYNWACARAIVIRPTTRANTTSILGAISAAGLITVSVKKARPAKKRKADGYLTKASNADIRIRP